MGADPFNLIGTTIDGRYRVDELVGEGGFGRDHPINCVDWSQANAYCEWKNQRLPTETEWEKAARGTDGRIYPWGSEVPSCQLAIMADNGDGCGKDGTWPVGSKPRGASPCGALDMAGNVWEWVADWYDSNYYAVAPKHNPEGPIGGSDRVFRGRSWRSTGGLRASSRGRTSPGSQGVTLGFRCARSAR